MKVLLFGLVLLCGFVSVAALKSGHGLRLGGAGSYKQKVKTSEFEKYANNSKPTVLELDRPKIATATSPSHTTNNKTIKCSSITAYYTGMFESPNSYPIYDYARFQFKLSVNFTDYRVYLSPDKWDSSYSSDPGNYFWYIYDGGQHSINYCDSGHTCTGPLSMYANESLVNFGNGNGFDILYFPSFDNSFTLYTTQSVTCTKEQPLSPNTKDLPDARFYDYCVCCGDYVNDGGLYCPVNPWAK